MQDPELNSHDLIQEGKQSQLRLTVKGLLLNLVLLCSSSTGANDSKVFHVSFEVRWGGVTQEEGNPSPGGGGIM